MDIVTSTIALISTDSSFWSQIPAAAYVLLGVVISGVFTIFSDRRNNKNNKELKELENKNNKELKELENKNNREVQDLEIVHNEKIQRLKEEGDKKLRLLDDKMTVFSEFCKCYSAILLSGTNLEKVKHIEKLRGVIFKLELLAPKISQDLEALDDELCDYANFYLEFIKKNISGEKKKKKIQKFVNKIGSIVCKIRKSLPNEL